MPSKAGILAELADLPSSATTAELLAAYNKIVLADRLWDAGAFVPLIDAATISVDLSTGINFVVTLAGNRTLGNFVNAKIGQSGLIRVNQDNTGNRTLSYASSFKFFDGYVPDLKLTAGAVNLLHYVVLAPDMIVLTYIRGVA